MRKKENYYEIWGDSQKTVRSLFGVIDKRIEIGNGEVILLEGDVQMRSLREGINALKIARKILSDCLDRIKQVAEVREIANRGDISGGTPDDVENRIDYISRLMKAIERTIGYLEIPQILEKDAVSAIHELIDLVIMGHPAPPITITVCEEYTI